MTLNLTKVIDLDLYFKLTYSFSTSGTYFRFYGPPYIMTIYALCKCNDFTTRGKLLTTKLLQQGYVCNRLKSTIKKFYGRHHDILYKYGRSVTSLITDLLYS